MLHKVVHHNGVEARVGEPGVDRVADLEAEAVREAELRRERLGFRAVVLHHLHAGDVLRPGRDVVETLARRAAAHIEHLFAR